MKRFWEGMKKTLDKRFNLEGMKRFDWKGLLGVLLVLAGTFAGLYFGIWWAFIGGIVAFIEAFQATPVYALDAAIAFTRIWFSALIGWAAALALIIPGLKLLK